MMMTIIIYDFLSEVGRRLSASSQDPRETSFLFQRLSVLIQRYNSVLILESFLLTKIRTSSHRGYFVFSFLFLALGPYTPEGIKMASRGFCESYTHSGVPIRLGQVVVNVCTRFEVSGINSFEDIKGGTTF